MSPISGREKIIIREAAEWHQRLQEGKLDAAMQRKFHKWLQSAPHLEEMARICLVDALLRRGVLKGELMSAPAENVSANVPANVIAFSTYARTRERHLEATPSARRFSQTVIAIAASLLLAAVTITALVGLMTTDQVMVTRVGRWDKKMLEDGTVVHAGPRTELRFHFDDEARAVTLVRGEALFEVAKQPARPFIVATDQGSVQALGTTFATADVGDTVVVTVEEGKVAVTPAGTDGMRPMLTLAAHQQTVLSGTGASQPVAVEPEHELKWLRDWYEYGGEQVGEIIAQLNLRHELKVVVDDPQVTRLRMNSLSFKPSQPQDFVAKINQWYADYPYKDGQQAGERRAAVLHLEST